MSHQKKPPFGMEEPLFTPKQPASGLHSNPWEKKSSKVSVESPEEVQEALSPPAGEPEAEKAVVASQLEAVVYAYQQAQEELEQQSADLQRMDEAFKAREAEAGKNFTVKDLLYYRQAKEQLEQRSAELQKQEEAFKIKESRVGAHFKAIDLSSRKAQEQLEQQGSELKHREETFKAMEAEVVKHFTAKDISYRQTQEQLDKQGVELQSREEQVRLLEAESEKLKKDQEQDGYQQSLEEQVRLLEAASEKLKKAQEKSDKQGVELQSREEQIRLLTAESEKLKKVQEQLDKQSREQEAALLKAESEKLKKAQEKLDNQGVELQSREEQIRLLTAESEKFKKAQEQLDKQSREQEAALLKVESEKLKKVQEKLDKQGIELQSREEQVWLMEAESEKFRKAKEQLDKKGIELQSQEDKIRLLEAESEKHKKAQEQLDKQGIELQSQEETFKAMEVEAVQHFKVKDLSYNNTREKLEQQGRELQKREEKIQSQEALSEKLRHVQEQLEQQDRELKRRQEQIPLLEAESEKLHKVQEKLEKQSRELKRREEKIQPQDALSEKLHEAQKQLQEQKSELQLLEKKIHTQEAESEKLRQGQEQLQEQRSELQRREKEVQANLAKINQDSADKSIDQAIHTPPTVESMIKENVEILEKNSGNFSRHIRNAALLIGTIAIASTLFILGPGLESYLSQPNTGEQSEKTSIKSDKPAEPEQPAPAMQEQPSITEVQVEVAQDQGDRAGPGLERYTKTFSLQKFTPPALENESASNEAKPIYPKIEKPAVLAEELDSNKQQVESSESSKASIEQYEKTIALRRAEEKRQKQIEILLTSANMNIKKDRLSRPVDNNALKNLREILDLEPDNSAARQGLMQVAERYVALAEKALANGDRKTTNQFLTKAKSIYPQLDSIRRVREDSAPVQEAPPVKTLNLDSAAQEKQFVTQQATTQPPVATEVKQPTVAGAEVLSLSQPVASVVDPAPAVDQRADYMKRLKATVDQVMIILKDKQLSGQEKQFERRSKLSQTIFSEFNLPGMSKRAVGRNWRKFSPEQKVRFNSVFTKLLERTYIKLLERYEGEGVKFVKEVKQSDRQVRVDSVISTSKQDYKLSYRLYRSDDQGWKVVDVIIEGISVVSNYRSQFKQLLRSPTSENIETLLDKLQKKIQTKSK
jgi:phospholipid transport system substrate-binding protein